VPAALLLLQLGFVACVVGYWQGGVLDTEATLFVTNYLDERPFLRQIFDPEGNDFANYQARELSYVLDWADARTLDALFRHGVVLLVPLSSLVGSVALLVVLPWAARTAFPGLPGTTAGLALLVYLSHFIYLSSAGLFYRSAKMVLVPLLIALAALVIRTARHGEPDARGRRVLHAAGLFALGCVASLLDRQGFFEVAAIAALLAVALVLGRRVRATFAALAGAAALATAYDLWLAPALIRRLNGYRPTFLYQELDLHKLLHKPVRLEQATELLASYTQTLLGGLPAALAVAFVVLVAVLWLRRPGPRRPRSLALAAAAAVLAAHGLMLVLMIHRHKPMYSLPDHRLCYYPLGFQGALLFGMCGLLALVVDVWGRAGRLAANGALALIVVANVGAWARDRARMEPWFPEQVHESTLLKRSLERGEAEPELSDYYRKTLAVLLARRNAHARRPPG
jgi:hypothetical protein